MLGTNGAPRRCPQALPRRRLHVAFSPRSLQSSLPSLPLTTQRVGLVLAYECTQRARLYCMYLFAQLKGRLVEARGFTSVGSGIVESAKKMQFLFFITRPVQARVLVRKECR